ncbi:MAG: hypothetical protein JW760_10730 [Spirochaetales bacterium]|nr:hypothetical protein [Spirochaetales bacterium]
MNSPRSDGYYEEIDARADELYAAGEYDGIITLLGRARAAYPGHLYEILIYTALAHLSSGNTDGFLETLEEMTGLGYFSDLSWRVFDSVREENRFKVLAETNNRLKEAAQKKARMDYQVVPPRGCDPGRSCPVFFALHGNGESLEYFRHRWPEDTLTGHGYMVVYIQSSQVACTNASGWTADYSITRRDILSCYEKVERQYSLDRKKTIIGGFSGGSIASIETVMADLFPVRGFIALCPILRPASFTPENAEKAASRGARGVILEGELEGDVPAEQEMMEIMKKAQFPFRFIVNPGKGHAFPEDFPVKLTQALDYILE